ATKRFACSGWQTKHCESGRSWSRHQSPLALWASATLGSHWPQSSSGMPCSLHHHPSWASAVAAAVEEPCWAVGVSAAAPQPANEIVISPSARIVNRCSKKRIVYSVFSIDNVDATSALTSFVTAAKPSQPPRPTRLLLPAFVLGPCGVRTETGTPGTTHATPTATSPWRRSRRRLQP